MVDPKIFPELAAHVIEGVNVRDGDAVYITGGTHLQEFLEEIGVEVARRGGEPFITAVSDRYQRRYFEATSVEAFLRTPKIGLAAAQAMDVFIVIEPFSDPSIKKGFGDKLKARSEGRQPITDVIYGKPGKRWVYMGWATEGMAKTYGVPLKVLERLVIESCLIDYGELKRKCRHVIGQAERCEARAGHRSPRHRLPGGHRGPGPAGGRRPLVRRKRGIRRLGREPARRRGVRRAGGDRRRGHHRLPADRRRPDAEHRAEGRAAVLQGRHAGAREMHGTAKARTILLDNLKKFVAIDMDKHGSPNALKIAELGIGMNPVIDRAIGYILTDEKIGGSVHVAFGRSTGYGGKVTSAMHWDFVTAPDVTVEVEYRDGSRHVLIKDGKLLK